MARPKLKGEFEKTYRFAHLPSVWMGESFTKAYVEVFFLTKEKETKKYRLYKIKYKANLTSDFFKEMDKRNVAELNSGRIDYESQENFIREITRWKHTDIEPLTKIDEFVGEFDLLTDKILELQISAKERGLIQYEF